MGPFKMIPFKMDLCAYNYCLQFSQLVLQLLILNGKLVGRYVGGFRLFPSTQTIYRLYRHTQLRYLAISIFECLLSATSLCLDLTVAVWTVSIIFIFKISKWH